MKSTAGKREAILEAAQGLFLTHGLRGTAMEAIARDAGIAKPTLYAYFPDKGAIFAALLGQLIATWRQDFLTALHGQGDVVQLGNKRGRTRLHARLFEGVKPGVLVSEGVWPPSAFLDGWGINVLVGDDSVAPHGGAAVHDVSVWARRG